ncbi:GNAT family N-acetyltransferase [Ignatzschineria rhizosphaerae]|uniref:GNAT family N-acetyltransferase n=1 Tax=Ignatzschineria rhizosphaerae TaxID=2923279 RepID=A0ABY3WWW3_9GAMM|nr:GNAT family N-acetyltransferase [Ignatzschineria rhizosphaerae]
MLVEEEIALFFQRLQALNTFRGFVLVDIITQKIVGASLGFIRPWYGGEQYHLDSLYIDVAYQNQKLGSYFLTTIKALLQESGVPAIFLDTEKGTDAEFFYQKNGFTPLTESVNYVYMLEK